MKWKRKEEKKNASKMRFMKVSSNISHTDTATHTPIHS